MFRKKRQPAPNFRMPGAPFNPVTGQRAQMGIPLTPGTILATFQVIGDDPNDANTQDTHANYVVCRGYDPENDPFFRYLHDPKTKPDTKSIKVAKPYGVRGTYPYKRGQIIVAAKIRTVLGENQGKAATTVGHPANLDEATELLFDDDNVAISWLDITTAPQAKSYGVASHSSSNPTVNVDDLLPMNALTAADSEYLSGMTVDTNRIIASVAGVYEFHFFGNVQSPNLPAGDEREDDITIRGCKIADDGTTETNLSGEFGCKVTTAQFQDVDANRVLVKGAVHLHGFVTLAVGEGLAMKLTVAFAGSAIFDNYGLSLRRVS